MKRVGKIIVVLFVLLCITATSYAASNLPDWTSKGYDSSKNPMPMYNYQKQYNCMRYVWGRAYERTGIELPSQVKKWYQGKYETGDYPKENSIALWGEIGKIQHSAYIESVDDTYVILSECGYPNKDPHNYNREQVKISKLKTRNSKYNGNLVTYVYIGEKIPEKEVDKVPGSFSIWAQKDVFESNENVVLNWSMSSNAEKYGLTIRRTSDGAIVFDDYVTGTEKALKLSAGNYRFAMRGYSKSGLKGPTAATAYFKVVEASAEDSTPGSFSIWAQKDTFNANESVILNWSVSNNAEKYGLTVRRTSDGVIVFDDYVAGTEKVLTLPVGSYRFAMRGYSKGGLKGPITNTAYFNVVEVIVEDSIPGSFGVWAQKDTFNRGESVVLNWSASLNAEQYGLTVRRVSDGAIVFDDYVTGNQKVLDLPAGNYRFAMRGYSKNGIKGPVTSVCYFNVN